MKRLPGRILLGLIGAYQRWVSPTFPRRCKYHPTCSDYAVQAVRELGVVKGSIVAGWRVLRCNPLSDGGVDDLSDRHLFRDASRRGRDVDARPTRRERNADTRPVPAPESSAGPGRIEVTR